MLTTRLYIKKKFPFVYQRIRSALFPIYLILTSKKRQSFTTKTSKLVTCSGHSFLISLNPENGFVDTEIFTSGVYEPEMLALIKKHLPLGGTFVDIGSNIGQHALFAASVVGRAGTVIAFEPIPSLVNQFKESISLNNFESIISIHPIACSDTKGRVTIKLKPGNIGGSSLHHTNASYSEITVATDCADSLLVNLSKIDLIKIDTEGHEVEALKGLKNTIVKHRPKILVEFSPSLRDNQASYSKNFFAILEKYSYSFYDLEEGDAHIAHPQSWSSAFTKTQTNLLCLPKQN